MCRALEKARKGHGQPLGETALVRGTEIQPGQAGAVSLARCQQFQADALAADRTRIPAPLPHRHGHDEAGRHLDEVAELRSPESDVADFINASHAIGIVESPRGSPYDTMAPAAQTGGVMSRLRSSLGPRCDLSVGCSSGADPEEWRCEPKPPSGDPG